MRPPPGSRATAGEGASARLACSRARPTSVRGVPTRVTALPTLRRSWWLRAPLAALFVGTGTLHFTSPEPFVAIVPEALPAPRALVYASGVAELLGGIGLLHARTVRPAGWWLIATLLAVFPANIGMAFAPERHPGIPEWALWLRLPLQAALIGWVYQAALARPRGRRRLSQPRPGRLAERARSAFRRLLP